jgi:basic membrane protein A
VLVRIVAGVAVALALCSCASAAGAAQPFRIGLVVQIGSRPLQGLTYSGFSKAAQEPGVSGRVVEAGPSGDPNPALELLVREGYNLIAVGPSPVEDGAQMVQPAAVRDPRTLFLDPDEGCSCVPSGPRNMLVTIFRPQEAAYLAGYLATLVVDQRPRPHVVSAVGGLSIPSVNVLIAGFRAGALAADPHIHVRWGYSQDFVDPAKCASVAREQIARHSTVVFNVAGQCGLGALETAKQHGVWGVGVDVDQSSLGPFILTSVVKFEDVALKKAIDRIRRGTFPFKRRVLVFGYANGGVGLGKISPRVSKTLLRRLRPVREALAAGRIKLPETLK